MERIVLPQACTLCPRRCGARRAAGQAGVCMAGDTLYVARAALHFWEEPCLSGTHGSGAVFFSGCALRCCYCQNYPISQQGVGKAIDAQRLAEIFLELQAAGARNLNLVTATQWLPWVLPALREARARGLRLPVVYNTGGYETVQTVQALEGAVDIWLTDLKYAGPELAARLSGAPDYPAVCEEALYAMLAQAGPPQLDGEGYLQKGVIVRHLALPGQGQDSLAVLQRLAQVRQRSGVPFLLSLMSQFTPCYHADAQGLGRRLTRYEYRRLVDAALDLGLDAGYTQQRSSAREEYTPPFDFEGV